MAIKSGIPPSFKIKPTGGMGIGSGIPLVPLHRKGGVPIIRKMGSYPSVKWSPSLEKQIPILRKSGSHPLGNSFSHPSEKEVPVLREKRLPSVGKEAPNLEKEHRKGGSHPSVKEVHIIRQKQFSSVRKQRFPCIGT